MFPCPLNVKSAIVRGLSPAFESCVTTVDLSNDKIHLGNAKEQHARYKDTLESILGKDNVHEIPADPNHPDCCFVEDTSVLVGKTWVITRLGHESRRGEKGGIKEYVMKNSDKFHVVEMPEPCLLDGGDVLNTGKHVIVGLSDRTNLQGYEFLKNTLNVPVLAVDMAKLAPGEPVLHLKCLVTSLDQETLVFSDEALGRALAEAEPFQHYEKIFVADRISSNILSFPEHQTMVIQQGFPVSEGVLDQVAFTKGWNVIKLQMSEFIKADGALTCCSVLIP